jgi:hypothetical protein
MHRATLAIVASLLLAGCSGKATDKDDDPLSDADFTDLDLDSTSTTGVIRGIVVDESIRPIAGANVAVRGAGVDLQATSDANGLFGFDELEPSTYFVEVTKAGFNATQTATDVVAGVEEPPIVRVMLLANPSLLPYFDVLKWEGFIQCSTRFVINALAACSALGPASSDNFTYRYHPDSLPSFAQSEMVWDSTQALGDGLKLDYTDDRQGLDNYVMVVGGSPLIGNANQSVLEAHDVDGDTGLYIRIFAGSVDGTTPPQCIPAQPCEGVSLVLNQDYTVYTTLFYHFTPPEGWAFTNDGEPQPPL